MDSSAFDLTEIGDNEWCIIHNANLEDICIFVYSFRYSNILVIYLFHL